MVRTFEGQAAELERLRHAELLVQALLLGERGLQVEVFRHVVRDAVQSAVAFELDAVVAAPRAEEQRVAVVDELRAQRHERLWEQRRAIDHRLRDARELRAERQQFRVPDRPHERLELVHGLQRPRVHEHRADLDGLHLLGWQRAVVARRRFEIDDEIEAQVGCHGDDPFPRRRGVGFIPKRRLTSSIGIMVSGCSRS